MRSRMVDKSAEACSSQMRLVFAERPSEFVGEVQHVDNKRIPVEYHKHNTPINDAYPVMKKFDYLPFISWGTQEAKGAGCNPVTLDTP